MESKKQNDKTKTQMMKSEWIWYRDKIHNINDYEVIRNIQKIEINTDNENIVMTVIYPKKGNTRNEGANQGGQKNVGRMLPICSF